MAFLSWWNGREARQGTANPSTRVQIPFPPPELNQAGSITCFNEETDYSRSMSSEYLEGPERPWGRYQVLADTPTYKVKTIWVEPGHRLSLQRHQKREEHWYIVSGVADVVLGEKEFKANAGESVEVAIGELHRIGNSGSEVMIFVEVQRGTYFGEDDIERIQDDYAR